MTKLQKVTCIILSVFFFAVLLLVPGPFFLRGNVYRQLPLYCFLEEEATSVPQREDPETYEKLVESNAKYLADIFAEHEVDRIYLNFSDPWPKDRHSKRRLTSEGFLNLYHTILNPDGYIQFKTDNRDLFDFSVETAENSPIWNIKELTYDLHHSEFLEGNIMTEYESKFVAEGKPICRFVLSR